MDIPEFRMQCLSLAAHTAGNDGDAEKIISAAEKFFRFAFLEAGTIEFDQTDNKLQWKYVKPS
ncbi:hypothetical protein D3877_19930 [Azospirillum cavernae]|uniref:Gene 1 ring forming protein domain-containing protein n=2 Tax=Azospirillum cavernae TaxID=2320860 RepID=A0A418VYQ5_9PROT|nr:hypothetical protein D3877_19930 [Azospirillum cavernae]